MGGTKTYTKIDIYFNGDYLCSTNQSKTCKEAVRKYIERLEYHSHSMAGLSTLQAYILKHKDSLKARFDRA